MNIMLLLPAKQTLNSAQSARARGGLRKPIQSIKIGHFAKSRTFSRNRAVPRNRQLGVTPGLLS